MQREMMVLQSSSQQLMEIQAVAELAKRILQDQAEINTYALKEVDRGFAQAERLIERKRKEERLPPRGQPPWCATRTFPSPRTPLSAEDHAALDLLALRFMEDVARIVEMSNHRLRRILLDAPVRPKQLKEWHDE